MTGYDIHALLQGPLLIVSVAFAVVLAVVLALAAWADSREDRP